MLVNTGKEMVSCVNCITDFQVSSKSGLLTTVAYQLGNGADPVYALEGSIPVAGSGVNWLRDNMGFIESAKDIGMCTLVLLYFWLIQNRATGELCRV